ncbi:MAG: SDR family NAD(P)-dependent oxidoreductase, partial [Candidatus Hodarchaeota archaeon]
GLGFEFVKQYLKRGENVIATCRKLDNAVKLHELQDHYKEKLTILQLDITDQKAINAAYRHLKQKINKIDLLISNVQLKNKGIIVLALHPGHVKTDLGNPYAPLVPEESINGMIRVIDSLTLEDTGKFLDWQKNELPW